MPIRSAEETIVTEIIANSLDSGALRIIITADPEQNIFTAVDNGSGSSAPRCGDISDDFPLLASLIERRAGGEKRLPISAKTRTEKLKPLRSWRPR